MVGYFGLQGRLINGLWRRLTHDRKGPGNLLNAFRRLPRRLIHRAAALRINLATPARIGDQGWSVAFAEPVHPDGDMRPGGILVRDVLVGDTINDSVLLLDGTILMNDDEFAHFSPAYFEVPRRFFAPTGLTRIRDLRPAHSIERGVFLGSFALDNWYHFVTRIAAGALLLPRLPGRFQDWPLLLPEADLPAASERLLEAVLDGRPVIRYPRSERLHVQQLLWMNPVTRGLNYLRPDAVDLVPFAMHRPTFDELRRRVLAMTDGKRSTARRVLLDRGPEDSRPYNRGEVMEALNGLGFEAVRLESLPLEEQIRVMAGADVVVGPTGAAWTNMLWMRSGARALYWIPRHLSAYSVWRGVARFSDVTIADHLFDVTDRRFFRVPYRIDVPRLESDVRRLLR